MTHMTPQTKVQIVDTHEISMAKSQVYRAAKCAMEIHKMLHQVDNLEGWMQSKITLAADYLESVSSNLEYDIVSAVMDPEPATMVDMPLIQVSDTQADLVESPTVTQQDAEKAGYTITAQKQSQASSTTKPTTPGGSSTDGNGNPFDKGTAHHAAFERGVKKASMKEAEMFPQFRQDWRNIVQAAKQTWSKFWDGTPEEQKQALENTREAWFAHLLKLKKAKGERVTAEDMHMIQALADQMVMMGAAPPLMSKVAAQVKNF